MKFIRRSSNSLPRIPISKLISLIPGGEGGGGRTTLMERKKKPPAVTLSC